MSKSTDTMTFLYSYNTWASFSPTWIGILFCNNNVYFSQKIWMFGNSKKIGDLFDSDTRFDYIYIQVYLQLDYSPAINYLYIIQLSFVFIVVSGKNISLHLAKRVLLNFFLLWWSSYFLSTKNTFKNLHILGKFTLKHFNGF